MLLKDYYDKQFAGNLADKIREHFSQFNKNGFVGHVAESIADKEYTERMKAFVSAFDKFLPSYPDAIRLFGKMLGPELKSFSVMYSDGAWLAPIGKYVEAHCAEETEYFDLSLKFIHELTKRYTGEFAIRPLIQSFPRRTMEALTEWSKSKNAFVRRCSCESLRVSLPWAKKMTAAVEQFDLYTKILDNLKNDEDPYVQRSVGNNLNDLYKYDPNKAFILIERWQEENPTKNILKIIRHGTRTARKEQNK